MNWDDPQQRAALALQVGPAEYNRRFREYQDQSTIETINGHAIRPVQTRFGLLYAVGGTNQAFSTLDAARYRAISGGE